MNPRYLALLDLYADRDNVILIIVVFAFGLAWTHHLLSTSQLITSYRARLLNAYWIIVLVAYAAALIFSLIWKG